MLQRHNYPFSRLDGSVEVSTRQPIIDQFNSTSHDKNFVFLISTRAGGLGLNITSANVVVVYDASWNVTQDKQAQDRAYRIGQTRHTDVYRFVSAGTVEEMIYQRQIYKQQMANIGLEGSQERRYFNGVLGVKGEEGEIFGLLNLLKLTTERVQSREIIERVEQEEELFKIVQSQLPDPSPTPMNKVFDSKTFNPKPDQIIDLDNLQSEIQLEAEMSDPAIAAALKKTGVVYSHNNMSVVGDNEVEKIKAEEATAYVRAKQCGEEDILDTSQPTITTINFDPSSNFTSSFPINQPKSLSHYEDILNRVNNPTNYDEFKTLTVTNFSEPTKPLQLYIENHQSETDTHRQQELDKQRQLQRDRKRRKIPKSIVAELPSFSLVLPTSTIPTNSLKRKLESSDEIAVIEEKPPVDLRQQRELQQQRKSQKIQLPSQTHYYHSPFALPPFSQILTQSTAFASYSHPRAIPTKTTTFPIQPHSSNTINLVDITGDN